MIQKNIQSPFALPLVITMFIFASTVFGQQTKTTSSAKIVVPTAKKAINNVNVVANKIAIQDTILNVIPENDSIKIIGNNKYILHQKNAHASYYAAKFTGRRTASGKIFNNNAYTCAHRKLPFGTKLRITSERTGKSVFVIVTDRGPFVRGRHIDLSKRAFFDIAPNSFGGSIKVTIEVVK